MTTKPALPKVFVALSGGVDSAVAALLLTQQGYDVTGVFMKNWSGEEFGVENECPWEKDQKDAESVCKHLKIPFKTYNFEKEYRAEVIENFFGEYKRGNTPNPDVLCNQQIKFGRFLQKAKTEGAEMIATGHYAVRVDNPDGTVCLARAKDKNKDQTYFLCRLNQQQLKDSLFPIGHLTKPEVRKLAADNKLPVAEKKDSQGICFLGKIDVNEFLMKNIKPKAGEIIDIDTKKPVGKHNGVWYYTMGQREGLRIGGAGEPYFVCGKNVKTNQLFVAKGKNNPALYTRSIELHDIIWNHPDTFLKHGEQIHAMIRYRQEPQSCRFMGNSIEFGKPVWLTSPGQYVALIKDNLVLGGGVIP